MKTFPQLTLLSKRIGRPISIFDLETTGLLDAEELGITEIAILTVYPDGNVNRFQTLIQPDYDIPARVTAITGITDSMVIEKPNFPEVWGSIKECFENNAIFGFNSNRFDIQVLQSQLLRYGIKPLDNVRSYDVRIWHHITTPNHRNAEKGLKGSLGEVSVHWNIPVPKELHRAGADVEVTTDIMEALLLEHGISPLRDTRLHFNKNTPNILPNISIKTTAIEAILMEKRVPASEIFAWVISDIRINGYSPVSKWAEELGLKTTHLEELLETSIDTKSLNAKDFRHEPTQNWLKLNKRLENILTYIYPSEADKGKLHYPHQELIMQLTNEDSKKSKDVIIDFIQLRIAMIDLKVPYVTRRNLLEEDFNTSTHTNTTPSSIQNPLNFGMAKPKKPQRPRFS